jgi:hypothetical protein
MAVVQFLHQIDHRVLHPMAQAEIAALAPAADAVAFALQKTAQRTRRGVGGNEAGQYQHRMPVTSRREAQQRQCAEKRAQLGNGSPLQKHQGSGWRGKRLRSNGHRISCSGRPLTSRQPAKWVNQEDAWSGRIVPQRNNLT